MEYSLKNALYIFFFILLTIYFTKPALLFEERSGRKREFGVGFNRDGEKKTLFDMTIIVVVASLISVVAL